MRKRTWKLGIATVLALSGCALIGCGGSTPSGPLGIQTSPLILTGLQESGLIYNVQQNVLYGYNQVTGTVDKIDPTTGKVLGSSSLGAGPNARAISSDGSYMYLVSGGYIRRYNLASGSVDENIPLFPGVTGSELNAVGASGIWPNPANPAQTVVQREFWAGIPYTLCSLQTFTSGTAGMIYSFPEPGISAETACFNQAGTDFFAVVTGYLVHLDNNLAEMHSPVAIGNVNFTVPIVEANGKLILGQTVFSEDTLTQIGHFGTPGSTWQTAGVPGQTIAFGFSPATMGTQPVIAQIDLNTCSIAKQWTVKGLPNPTAQIADFTYAGPNRIAFMVQDKSDQKFKLAMYNVPN